MFGNRSFRSSRTRTPGFMGWFFDYVFPFLFIGIGLLVLAIFALAGYLIYSVGNNPEMVGQFLGLIVQGFQETVNR